MKKNKNKKHIKFLTLINVLTWSAVKFLKDCEICELFNITCISGIINFPPISILCAVNKFWSASFAPASKNGRYSLGFVLKYKKIINLNKNIENKL